MASASLWLSGFSFATLALRLWFRGFGLVASSRLRLRGFDRGFGFAASASSPLRLRDFGFGFAVSVSRFWLCGIGFTAFGFAVSASRFRFYGFGSAASASRFRLRGFCFAASALASAISAVALTSAIVAVSVFVSVSLPSRFLCLLDFVDISISLPFSSPTRNRRVSVCHGLCFLAVLIFFRSFAFHFLFVIVSIVLSSPFRSWRVSVSSLCRFHCHIGFVVVLVLWLLFDAPQRSWRVQFCCCVSVSYSFCVLLSDCFPLIFIAFIFTLTVLTSDVS